MSESHAVTLDLAFVEGSQGHVLHTRFLPDGAPRVALVFVHAFGEELAKSRHVVSAAARGLAARGIAVCAIDLYGCGDSAGSLADTRFESWTDDVVAAAKSMGDAFGVDCHLWAMRSGALTAMQALRQWGNRDRHLLLWQPVARGRLTINEFLRLRTAASMMGGAARESVDGLREQLATEGVLEVAGHPLGRNLVDALDRAELAGDTPAGTRIAWFDVGVSPDRPLSPAARRLCEGLRSDGAQVCVERVQGPAFWSSGELQFCTALIERTVEHATGALLP